MNINLIHHYTNISTLALILKYKTIRFNRLDRVDDITESESFDVLKLSKYFFVSCWTCDQVESIPQWNMYTDNMAGVRISLPKNMFNYQILEVPTKYEHLFEQGEEILSPIPFEKIFTNDYMINPTFFNEIGNFSREMKYDKDYKERKNLLIKVQIPDRGEPYIKLDDITGMACLKDPAWAFQKEFRFVLLILPALPLPENKPVPEDYFKKSIGNQIKKILKGEDIDLEYFDVNINPEKLDEILITTGPFCSESEIILVESLIEKYAPNAIIKRSVFEGTIRKP